MLAAYGRKIPPSKVMAAVEPAPRSVGKAGKVTSAVPPILMVEILADPSERCVKLLTMFVPPVRFRLALMFWEPLVEPPPIVRVPMTALPPV